MKSQLEYKFLNKTKLKTNLSLWTLTILNGSKANPYLKTMYTVKFMNNQWSFHNNSKVLSEVSKSYCHRTRTLTTTKQGFITCIRTFTLKTHLNIAGVCCKGCCWKLQGWTPSHVLRQRIKYWGSLNPSSSFWEKHCPCCDLRLTSQACQTGDGLGVNGGQS